MSMTLEEISQYWTQQAKTEGQSHAASWSDLHAIDLEIVEMNKRLKAGDKVIDIGCANGFSTAQYAASTAIDIKGVDYIPEMVEAAKARLPGIKDRLKGKVHFDVGDITKLAEPDGAYDTAIVTRVVINLGSRDMQAVALRECARVLKKGGRLLLSEATLEGWGKLNAFREEWKLPPIPQPEFNLYLDEPFLCSAMEGLMELEEVVNFASTYFVFSRVIKPLLAQALNNGVDAAAPLMEWNRFFSMMPAVGDYGTQKLFVFRRL